MLYYILKAKQGGKYLDRKKVVDRKTGKMRYKYKYKPMQQRAAHEVTRNKFEKVTKLSGDEHKNQIEHALQNGIHVSLHVLRDYPDLAVKYHQQARLAKADKIRAKVKTHKEKERMEREVRLNTPEGLKNNPIKLEAERMMREDGLNKYIKTQSDNREVENNFDTMPESKPEPAKNPDLKANFESWKEERKQAAPAFKLEQEDITSKEKNTRFNDAQGGLFGKKPVTHESYAKKDFKPALSLEGDETITSLVTAVKSALLKEGLDTKAREFVDKAFKEKDINSLKKLASEYVDVKESSQVSNPSTENKGSEEKKMDTVKWQDVIKLKGSDKQIKYAKDLLALKNNEQYSTKFYILSKLIQKSATTNPDKEFNASEIISLMKDNWSKAHTKKVGELLGHEISNVPPNDNYNPLDDYIATKVLGATWDENIGFYIKDGNTVNVPDWILGSKLEYPDHIAGQKDKENAAIIKEWLKN